jgi:hypothetical protein
MPIELKDSDSAAADPRSGKATTPARSLSRFLAIGTLLSTTEEFLTIVLLRGDIKTWLFTLLILFPVSLVSIYVTGAALARTRLRQQSIDSIRFLISGGVGLAIEWFIIGLSPWSNPSANPIVMSLFQLGMFSFWASVGFVPWLFVQDDTLAVTTRNSLLRFFVRYFTAVFVAAILTPRRLRFALIIPTVILGFMVVAGKCIRYILLAGRRTGIRRQTI